MTIVGDLGQASRLGAIRQWDEALRHLPSRREPRLLELTVNYRTPTEIMELAAAVLLVAEAEPFLGGLLKGVGGLLGLGEGEGELEGEFEAIGEGPLGELEGPLGEGPLGEGPLGEFESEFEGPLGEFESEQFVGKSSGTSAAA